MRSYRWTAEQAAELAESMLQFNLEADAEMAARGYRPGAGLPFQGMPAEMFPHDLELDDPLWVDEYDYPDHPEQFDHPGQLDGAGDAVDRDQSDDPGHRDGPGSSASFGRPGGGLDASRGYPYGIAAGAAGPIEAMERVLEALERVEVGVAGLLADRAILFEQALILGETGSERSRAGSRQLALRSLRAELGAALRIPERTIEGLLGVSRSLVNELPATLDALRVGAISYRHAQIMVDHTAGLSDAARAVLEGRALPHATRLTASKFNQKARVLRELLDPESITERHARAREDREVRLDPQQDGLALLSQLLPAPEAVAIFNRLTDAAVSLQGPTEVRTLAQLRADIFSEVMLDGTDVNGAVENGTTMDVTGVGAATVSRRGPRWDSRRANLRRPATSGSVRWSRPGIPGMGSFRDRYFGTRPRLSVTVPALVLLGLSEEPASLDGYGPIDPNTARLLAAGAPSMIRLLTHPETGAILSVGRDRYRVPADLRAFLRVRDETCRFPGCSRPAELCDIDHTLQWQHQHPTAHYNLAHLCPGHHTIKDETAWAVEHTTDGTGALEWTSPTGRKHITEPATVIRAGVNDNLTRALDARAPAADEGPPPF